MTSEVSAVLAAMDKKQQAQFLAKTWSDSHERSVIRYLLVLANQDPSATSFLNRFVPQFTTKILLGNANQDTPKMALGEITTIGDIENFRGVITWQTDSQSNRKILRPEYL